MLAVHRTCLTYSSPYKAACTSWVYQLGVPSYTHTQRAGENSYAVLPVSSYVRMQTHASALISTLMDESARSEYEKTELFSCAVLPCFHIRAHAHARVRIHFPSHGRKCTF